LRGGTVKADIETIWKAREDTTVGSNNTRANSADREWVWKWPHILEKGKITSKGIRSPRVKEPEERAGRVSVHRGRFSHEGTRTVIEVKRAGTRG
jgi:hypothetical protein